MNIKKVFLHLCTTGCNIHRAHYRIQNIIYIDNSCLSKYPNKDNCGKKQSNDIDLILSK